MGYRFYVRRDLNHGIERWVLYENHRRGWTKIGSLKGWRLSLALPYIRRTTYQPKALENGGSTRRVLEEDGVRLALTFLGVRSMRKLERAERLCHEIHSMSQEESYYWYAKALEHSQTTIGIRALRTLFSGN